jgi:hypothetical protein
MLRRGMLPLVVGLAALLSSCGSSSTDTTDAAPDQPIGAVESPAATTATPSGAGGIAGAVGVAVDALQGADGAACDADFRTLETASEIYLALNGAPPPSQDALVEAQMLVERSTLFEITAEGAIVAVPGSPCA